MLCKGDYDEIAQKSNVVTLSYLKNANINELVKNGFSNDDYRISLLSSKLERHPIANHISFSTEPLKATLVYRATTELSSICAAYELGQHDISKDVTKVFYKDRHDAFQ